MSGIETELMGDQWQTEKPSGELAEQNVVFGADGMASDMASSTSELTPEAATASLSINGEWTTDQSFYYPPPSPTTNCYNYYYPGTDSRSHQSWVAPISNFSKSTRDAQPFRPSNHKVSRYQGNGYHHSSVKYSSGPHQKEGNGGGGAVNYRYPQNSSRTTTRAWSANNKIESSEYLSAHELTRGPRSESLSSGTLLNNKSDEKKEEELGLSTIRVDGYNSQDFQIDYENAKFYIIKSYNEDNIHRCVKYGVWASTPSGNKKLDAVFRKANGTDEKCPVFLFFSVNGSGQFVGVAEMIGQVDFNRDMDFWQLDKWTGFFPVKWHIIKDIPHSQLRHIILENNDNKPVTYTRDTQEVPLKQGLEMLNIFKKYSEKTSVLDDFRIYEKREKSNIGIEKKIIEPESSNESKIFLHHAPKMQSAAEESGNGREIKKQISKPTTSLIDLAKNLSLNS